MGLFDFAKEAGERLRDKASGFFGGDAEAAEAATQEISQSVQSHKLPVDDFRIRLDGEKAIIEGKAPSQEIKEKAILVVGNTVGISQVEENIQVAAADVGPQARFYTVKKGDSLSKIAKAVYGDAMKYPVIFEANKPMLADPDKIYPGQSLRIPEL